MSAATKQGVAVSSTGRAITAINPVWAGLTEMDMGNRDSIAELQRNMPKHQVLTADPTPNHSREVPIAFRRSRLYRVESVVVLPLSPDIPGKGVGNDRHVTVVRYARLSAIRRRVKWRAAAVCTHTNAAIQLKDGSLAPNARARAMDKVAMPRLEKLIKLLQAEHRAVQLVGDVNWRANLPKSDEWVNSPDNVFTRCGLRVFAKGLDRTAHSRRSLNATGRFTILWKDVGTIIVEPGRGGNRGDHPWAITTVIPQIIRLS